MQFVPRPAICAAYRAQQAAIRYSVLVAHRVLRLMMNVDETPSETEIHALEREYEALLKRDLDNAERGFYPHSLLFQLPVASYIAQLPRWLLDLPRIYQRFQKGEWADLSEVPSLERYPKYFRRNFHWQTDGYLSRRSAELYDLSVEILFLGCADVMRRQVIPPISRRAKRRRRTPLRILDVGCGTGRTLGQIAAAVPGQQYYGVDLSPFYVEGAREHLASVPEVTLVADNAEHLPFRDAHFDAVTSVFLFHELPRRSRRQVLSEISRVLRPGGVLAVVDSAQLAEADDLSFFLERFPAQMHEPFYADYLRDDLAASVSEAGLAHAKSQRAWLSKVVTAQKQR